MIETALSIGPLSRLPALISSNRVNFTTFHCLTASAVLNRNMDDCIILMSSPWQWGSERQNALSKMRAPLGCMDKPDLPQFVVETRTTHPLAWRSFKEPARPACSSVHPVLLRVVVHRVFEIIPV